jgi:glycosyltransferase involved in cell wall biosynthesis
MATAPWGGSEALWGETALRALDAGHEVFVSVYGWPSLPPVVVALAERGALIHRRRLSKRWRRSRILTTLFYPFRELHQFRPDVVLVNQGSTYDISRGKEFHGLRRALIKTERWPYMLLCHCEQAAPRHARAVKRARTAFMAARHVGLLSHSLRERSENHLGVALPHAKLFQNPLQISSPGPQPWPRGETLRFAFVGRIEPVKGLHVAIEVLHSATWRNRDWLFDVYGGGEQQPALEEQVSNFGLADRVRFQGVVTDIDAIWREHHVLLLPSRAEGVPNSMLEAMLSARPVIVSNVGGIAEWVNDGENGYLLPQPNVLALEEAMERLWQNRQNLQHMGQRAFEQTSARRDQDPVATLLGWLERMRPG